MSCTDVTTPGHQRKRLITLYRKPAPDMLDWDFHITEPHEDVSRVIDHLVQQGVWQYSTWEIGAEELPEFSAMLAPVRGERHD